MVAERLLNMNYSELGLPHSTLVPPMTVSPRPLLPVSGLSRKYLGIELMSKTEVDSLIDRLSKPKRQNQNQEVNYASKEASSGNSNKRFVGRKRMTTRDISSMVDRLSKGSASRAPDSRRVQPKEVKRERGLTASYAWQGCHKYPTTKWTTPAIMFVK